MDLRRVPRRYPRLVLTAIYALEGLFERVLCGKRWYARQLRAGRLAVRTLDVAVEDLPAALEGLRIAHLSDFHAGPFLGPESLADVVAATNALTPDLVCLTGDFITHRADEGVALAPAFAAIRAPLGAFAVFGNHDYRERREGEIERALAAAGVRTLRNSGAAVERGGARVVISGIEDVEEGKVVDLDAALARRRAGDLLVLLAHHPDTVLRVGGRGIGLVLSGHTHGGQVVLAGRSVFGFARRSRYLRGLHRVDGTMLHVSAGIGVLVLPFRVGAPAEVALLRLVRALRPEQRSVE